MYLFSLKQNYKDAVSKARKDMMDDQIKIMNMANKLPNSTYLYRLYNVANTCLDSGY